MPEAKKKSEQREKALSARVSNLGCRFLKIRLHLSFQASQAREAIRALAQAPLDRERFGKVSQVPDERKSGALAERPIDCRIEIQEQASLEQDQIMCSEVSSSSPQKGHKVKGPILSL